MVTIALSSWFLLHLQSLYDLKNKTYENIFTAISFQVQDHDYITSLCAFKLLGQMLNDGLWLRRINDYCIIKMNICQINFR